MMTHHKKIKDDIIEVLTILQPAINILKEDCFVIGSAAMVLSDITVGVVADIDLLTSASGADQLKVLWKEHVKNYQPEDQQKFRSKFQRYGFGLMDVEVMGDLEVYTDRHWEKVSITEFVVFRHGVVNIKIPAITDQKRILKLFGRPKDLLRLKLIK